MEIESAPNIADTGCPDPCDSAYLPIDQMQAETIASTSRLMCTLPCHFDCARRVSQCAYAYPAKSAVWKNTRHVTQTAADPPKTGNNCFAAIGSSKNKRNEPRNTAALNKIREGLIPTSVHR